MVKLSKYEKEIENSIGTDEWEPVTNQKTEIERLKRIAYNTIKKDKRINIRISTKDFDGIQKKAIEEGIPYQTLISSIIHKYLLGKFIEKKI